MSIPFIELNSIVMFELQKKNKKNIQLKKKKNPAGLALSHD